MISTHCIRKAAPRGKIGWHPIVNIARRGLGGRPRSTRVLHEDAVRAAAEQFRNTHARLLGAQHVVLRPTRWQPSRLAWHATWQQWHEGRRVLGSILDLTLLEDGTTVAFRSTLLPGLQAQEGAPSVAAAQAACEAAVETAFEVVSSEPVWVADAGSQPFTAVEALEMVLRTPTGARWRAVVGTTRAEILQLESMVRTSQLTGTTVGRVKPHYAHDPWVDVPLPWLEIQLGFSETDPRTFADQRGLFQFVYPEGQVTVRSALTGRFVSVDNEAPQPAPYFQAEVSVPGSVEVRFGAVESREDERTIYHHVNRIHDFMAERFDFTLLDFPVQALAAAHDPNTGDPNYPNAYWDGEKLGFGNGGNTFWNLGLFGDVVYHEYTHAVTQFMYMPGGPLVGVIGGAIHEALADYFAATMTGDSRLGERLRRRSIAPLRDLENSLYWPAHRDPNDEVHANGEIFGGALWDVRTALGAEKADAIIHFARELFPRNFEEYLDAMLLQDDLLFGDGWSGNGSPHRDAILQAFAVHGIGPLRDEALEIVHAPLGDTDDSVKPRSVRATVRARLKNPDPFVRLSYRLAGTDEFEHAWMFPDQAGGFVAEIPPFPLGSDVDYYIAAGQFDPVVRRGFLPVAAPEEFFRFHVGPDQSPPRITHAGRSSVAAFAWPPDLYVRIEDNGDIAYAFVEYEFNGERGATLGLVPTAEDPNLYRARFPNVGGFPGDQVSYWITAVDASKDAHSTRWPTTGGMHMSVVRDLVEGFEGDQGRWQHHSMVAPQPDAWQLTETWNRTPGGSRAWLCGSESGDYPLGIAAALVTDWYAIDPGATASVWSLMDARELAADLAVDGGRIEIQVEPDPSGSCSSRGAATRIR